MLHSTTKHEINFPFMCVESGTGKEILTIRLRSLRDNVGKNLNSTTFAATELVETTMVGTDGPGHIVGTSSIRGMDAIYCSITLVDLEKLWFAFVEFKIIGSSGSCRIIDRRRDALATSYKLASLNASTSLFAFGTR